MIFKKDDNLIESNTGEILGSLTPRFQGLNFKDYEEESKKEKYPRFIEPMSATELKGEKLDKFIEDNILICENKFDGHRALIHLLPNGNRIFGRGVSKKTGWLTEITDNFPHIRDLIIDEDLTGTILDGELLVPIDNCTCREVQSVSGALPSRAIDYQIDNGLAYIQIFDIPFYKNISLLNMQLYKRKAYLKEVLGSIDSQYLKLSEMKTTEDNLKLIKKNIGEFDLPLTIIKSFEEEFTKTLAQGGEGIMLKTLDSPYRQTRTKYFVKMKSKETFDVVICGYEKPTELVDFSEMKTLQEDWKYWYNPNDESYWEGKEDDLNPDKAESIAVTKFACKGWIGAIIYGVYSDGKLIEIGTTSGMTEEVREYITNRKEELLGTVIELEAQCIIDKEIGTLQHPRFIRLRPDKNAEQCTLEDHLRK